MAKETSDFKNPTQLRDNFLEGKCHHESMTVVSYVTKMAISPKITHNEKGERSQTKSPKLEI